MEAELPSFLERLAAFEKEAAEESNEKILEQLAKYVPKLSRRQEGFSTPAEIQYVALGGSFAKVPYNFGALRVARHLLNYDYLWNEVRVKGGAYGVACQFNREGEGYFTSYRDPNLSATINVYKKAADFLAGYDAQEREVTKTIIGTISGMDTPLTPNMKGKIGRAHV